MGDDPSSIGLQHPAFAVPKSTLLQWIEDTFQLKYAKVEECATGAFYCQVLDCLYPGQIRMNLVNWNAKNDYEWVNNFKLAQTVMNKNNISKPIPVDKLVKAKYQDNLEFLQWFKHFYECKYQGQEYDAPARRALAKDGGPKGVAAPPKKAPGKAPAVTAPAAAPKALTKPAAAPKALTKPAEVKSAKPPAKPAAKPEFKAGEVQDDELQELTAKIQELQSTTDGLEQERDFYYGKLREVEILCQEEGAADFSKEKVLAVLYKTDDEAAAAATSADETL